MVGLRVRLFLNELLKVILWIWDLGLCRLFVLGEGYSKIP